MSFTPWSSEGKINIDESSPLAKYLSYLGSDCEPGVYAYKSQRETSKPQKFRILIRKLELFGTGHSDHLIATVDLRAQPPVTMWHFTDSNEKRIGSIEAASFSIAASALVRD